MVMATFAAGTTGAPWYDQCSYQSRHRPTSAQRPSTEQGFPLWLAAGNEKSGKRIVICRNGKPVADLVPHHREVSMAADKKLGAIKIKYDPTEEASEVDWPPDAR